MPGLLIALSWVAMAAAAFAEGRTSTPAAAPPATAATAAARRAAPRAILPLHERIRRDSLRLAAGVQRASFDSLNASLIRDLAAARRAGDAGALRRLLLLQGAGHAMTGGALRALPALDEALPLIEADRDTAGWLAALRWRAYAAGALGRFDAQERDARRLVALAEATGNARFEAIGHNFLGWLARQRGDLRQARAHLERAVEGHRALRNESEEAFARIAYGATLTDLGDYAAARRSYARQLEIARRLKQGWTEAQAWNDLAVLERRVGDPGRAVAYLRRGYEGLRARGETPELVHVLDNLAVAEMELGRAANARDLAAQALEICERRGYASLRGSLLAILANSEEQLGRPAAAEAVWRRAVALGDSVTPDARAFAVLGLSRALQRRGQDAEALVLLERAAAELAPKLAREDAARLHNGHANRLRAVGRHADALAAAERALAAERGAPSSPSRVSAWGTIALCQDRLGRPAAAKAAFDSAAAAWERLRGRSADPEWRSSLWSLPGGVRPASVEFLLRWPASSPEPARVAAAYERLQQFRGRTLLEQATRPRGSDDAPPAPPPAWTTARVQRELLAEGELLLEWAVGESRVVLFAITRHERRAFALGSAPDLRDRVRTARDLLGSAPRGDGDAAASEVARELARVVFGPALPMVERARSLLLVPDGELHRVPFAALATRSGPLVDARAIASAPSVALLGQSRARRHAASRGLLVVPVSGGGRRLAGAEREAAWLAGAFERAERAPTGARDPEAFAETLGPYDVLHFAGHTEYDDRFPWLSGIDIGAPEVADAIDDPVLPAARAARAGARPLLRAGTIAGTPLSARLVVLSSCETAEGRIVAGEGLAGLSTAFLAGGAHTVVASLWPVDDRATETLMREFYRVLASGRNASAALRMAQNRVRRDRTTRHPFYWAGFVLVGDGATVVPLEPTPAWRRLLPAKPLGGPAPAPGPAAPRNPVARGGPGGL